jgi:hypothetical protein
MEVLGLQDDVDAATAVGHVAQANSRRPAPWDRDSPLPRLQV